MAVTSSLVAAQIQTAAPTFSGVDWIPFTQLLGSAFVAWLPSCQTQGITTGTAGSGSVLGTLTVAPNASAMISAFQSGNLSGVDAPALATAIAIGFANAVTQAGQYSGASAGVGVGTDTSTIVSAPPTVLSGLIVSQGFVSGFQGMDLPQLANVIGQGASQLLLGSTGTGAVSGAGSSVPASGVSTGVLF